MCYKPNIFYKIRDFFLICTQKEDVYDGKGRYARSALIAKYIYNLLVCLFVSNKRQNGRTDRAQISCGITHDPRESLSMIKIKNQLLENLV